MRRRHGVPEQPMPGPLGPGLFAFWSRSPDGAIQLKKMKCQEADCCVCPSGIGRFFVSHRPVVHTTGKGSVSPAGLGTARIKAIGVSHPLLRGLGDLCFSRTGGSHHRQRFCQPCGLGNCKHQDNRCQASISIADGTALLVLANEWPDACLVPPVFCNCVTVAASSSLPVLCFCLREKNDFATYDDLHRSTFELH